MRDYLKTLVRTFRLTDRAVLAKVARAVLLALAGLGWLALDDATVNAIASAVAVVGSALLTPMAKEDTPE